jgi:beta-lactamase regulating signal transducer with metallopeptidase domain/outer membrane protein assembly factor BamB
MAISLTQVTNYLLAQSWQIAVLVIVIAVINYALRDKSAHIRYLLWLIIIAKCLVPPFYAITLAILPPQSNIDITSLFPHGGKSPPKLEVKDTITPESSELSSNRAEIQPAPVIETVRTEIDFKKWLGIGWLIGACAFLIFNLLRALRANLWLWRYRKALPVNLIGNIEKSFSTSGIKKFPEVWLIEGFNQPFVWGLLRGSIYLPIDFLNVNKQEHQKSVLCHEISHILRYDAAVNILQIIAQIVFWFHPFVWWANHKIRQEREKCCDEMAIAQLNTLPRDYSTAILETLAARHEQTRPVPTLAVAGPVKNIEERIKTMLRPGKKFHKYPSLKVALVVILIAISTVPTTLVLSARGNTGQSTAEAENSPPNSAKTHQGSGKLTIVPAPEAHFGDLICIYQDPNVNGGSLFGQSIATVGGNILVGAPHDEVAYLFDGSTGKLLRTFMAPPEAKPWAFGWCVAALGRNVLIADVADRTDGLGSGRVYLFNGLTGELLRTFANPRPDTYVAFGLAVAGMGDDRVIVEAWPKDTTGRIGFVIGLVLDASTGKTLQVFQTPRAKWPTTDAAWVTTIDQQVLIGAPEDNTGAEKAGAVYTFDSTTGKPVRTFLDPTPAPSALFGNCIAVAGNRVLIGAALATIDGKKSGAAYLFERETGKLLHSFMNPAPSEAGKYSGRLDGDYFGRSVAFVGNNILIGVTWDDTGAKAAGVAHLFDGATGNLLHKFVNPDPVPNAHFGVQVAALGNNILTAARDREGGSRGAVYLFKGVD